MTIDAINITETTALAAPTTCRVEGLEMFLGERYLEHYLPRVAAWCEEMGAMLLEEVEEELTTLAEDLQLKPLEKKRLFGPARRPRAAVPALVLKAEEDCSTESTVTAAELSTAATTPAETPVATPREPEAELLSPAPSRRTCWADIDSSDDEEPEERPQCPTPPRVRSRLPSDEWAKYRRRPRVVTWATPLAVPAEPAPRVPSDSTKPAEAEGWTLPKKTAPKAVRAEPTQDEEGFQEVQSKRKEVALQLEDGEVGMLIGTRGRTVHEIQDASGARVVVLPKKDGARLRDVKVRGATKQVDAALELIRAALPKTTQVAVEDWQVGALFGYKGETIAWIQRESKARVGVLEEQQDGKRTVVIRGPTEAVVAKGQALVLECIQDAQPPVRVKNQSREAAAFFSRAAVEAKTGARAGYARAQPLDHLPRGQGDRKRA